MRYDTPLLEDFKDVDVSTVIGALPSSQFRSPSIMLFDALKYLTEAGRIGRAQKLLGSLLLREVTGDIAITFGDEPVTGALTSPRTYIFTYSKPTPPLETSVDSIEPSVYRLLGSPLRELVSKVLEVISYGRQEGIPIKSVGLTTFSDPEVEDGEEIVFNITLQCLADQALEYWDRLSNEVNALKVNLSLTETRLLDDKISINVEWE